MKLDNLTLESCVRLDSTVDSSDANKVSVSDLFNFFKVDNWCKNHPRSNDRFVTVIESQFENFDGDSSDGK